MDIKRIEASSLMCRRGTQTTVRTSRPAARWAAPDASASAAAERTVARTSSRDLSVTTSAKASRLAVMAGRLQPRRPPSSSMRSCQVEAKARAPADGLESATFTKQPALRRFLWALSFPSRSLCRAASALRFKRRCQLSWLRRRLQYFLRSSSGRPARTRPPAPGNAV